MPLYGGEDAMVRLKATIRWFGYRETPWAGWPARFRVIGRTR